MLIKKMVDNEPIQCKVVLVGESGVGKTSLSNRYIKNSFFQVFSNHGVLYETKTVFLKDCNQSIKFEIWDTAGQEKYRSLAKVFYKNASACILVYDITKKDTFQELKNFWRNEVTSNAPENMSK